MKWAFKQVVSCWITTNWETNFSFDLRFNYVGWEHALSSLSILECTVLAVNPIKSCDWKVPFIQVTIDGHWIFDRLSEFIYKILFPVWVFCQVPVVWSLSGVFLRLERKSFSPGLPLFHNYITISFFPYWKRQNLTTILKISFQNFHLISFFLNALWNIFVKLIINWL